MVGFFGVYVLEQGQNLVIVSQAQGAQEDAGRDLALAVHLDRQDVLVAGLELQPGPAGGDELGHAQPAVAAGVALGDEIDARRAHQLADHDTLGAVDDERAVAGHHGEVPHEYGHFLDFARFLHHQVGGDIQRLRVGYLPFLALLRGILGFAELMLPEVELILLFRVVLDRRDFLENFLQPLIPEPAVGLNLALNEVGDFQHLGNTGVGADILPGQGMPVAVVGMNGRQSHS